MTMVAKYFFSRARYLLKIVFCALVWLFMAANDFAQDNLSTVQLKVDFQIFENSIKEAHPGLYRYNTPSQFDSILNQAARRLDQPMTRQEFYQTLLPLAVQIKCGHTKFHPDENWSDNFYFGKEKVFPVRLYIHGDKAWIMDTYDPEIKITKGSELISINNKPVSEVIQKLLSGFFSDGNNITFKYIEMSKYFSAYYANLIEAPDSFVIRYRKGSDSDTLKLPSINYTMIDQYEKKQTGKSSAHVPYSLEILPGNTALLTISSFWMGSESAYKRFLKRAFLSMRQKETENLIIDVRNNEGGNDNRGALLLSWLMNKEFRYYDRLQVTTNKKFTFARYAHLPKFYGIMRHLIKQTDSGTFVWNHNPNLKIQKPKKNSFKGKVYVLINGSSFSVTSEFAAVAHYLKRATFIGEETGGGYYGNNSGTFVIVTLPNSRLNIGIPMVAYYTAVKDYPFRDRGIIPDHEVIPVFQDILNNDDVVLAFTLELLKNQK
jgi:hypothetical protein